MTNVDNCWQNVLQHNQCTALIYCKRDVNARSTTFQIKRPKVIWGDAASLERIVSLEFATYPAGIWTHLIHVLTHLPPQSASRCVNGFSTIHAHYQQTNRVQTEQWNSTVITGCLCDYICNAAQ